MSELANGAKVETMARPLPIPRALLEQNTIVLGKTRSGKSSTMRALVERELEANAHVCIIDPKGDWWGIKSSADGKAAGYPLVIFGGDHADVPLNAHAGAKVAEVILAGNRPSLIDLGGWMVGERTRFFVDFASTLFRKVALPLFLVIDEVHNFAPQQRTEKNVDANKMLHWANRLASEGLGRGITLLAASQRPQKVHKDFVTSCETLIAKQVNHNLDRSAIKLWIDGCADPTKGGEVMASLAQLQKPEAWVWSPEAGFGPKRVTLPMFTTYDSFKAPKRGQAKAQSLKGWADVDLAEITAKLADVVKEAEANDPKKLKDEIAKLKRELMSLSSTTTEAAKKDMAPELQRLRDELANLQHAFDRQGNDWARALTEAQIENNALRSVVDRIAAAIGETPAKSPAVNIPPAPVHRITPPVHKVAKAPIRQPNAESATHWYTNGTLPIGETAVLSACIQFPEGLQRDQLSVLTQYKRSTRDSYMAGTEGTFWTTRVFEPSAVANAYAEYNRGR